MAKTQRPYHHRHLHHYYRPCHRHNLTLSPRYDELSISYGDVINIHDKQEDDWWLGECEGKVGIFPATYVEQI